MDLTADLLSVQGILTTLERTIGPLAKIRHIGGNEPKVKKVAEELKKFLESKHYSGCQNNKEISDIVIFLLLNSEFESPLNVKEYSHLIGIMPKLSKCLLVNIVVDLDLVEFYCSTVHTLHLDLTAEILNEMIPCLRRRRSDIVLKNTFIVVKEIIKKLSGVDISSNKIQESVDSTNDIAAELLLFVSTYNVDNNLGWNKAQIYTHMGDVLLKLFKLILFCQIENETLATVIDKLVLAISSVVKAVTIDVYCVWAEVSSENKNNDKTMLTIHNKVDVTKFYELDAFLKRKSKGYVPKKSQVLSRNNVVKFLKEAPDDVHLVTKVEHENQNLQMMVREEAYHVLEKLSKYKHANDLVQMLGTMATKPKTLQEQIMGASLQDIVRKINACNKDQRQWFVALLNTKVFDDLNSMNCLDTWWQLCKKEDLNHLLLLSTKHKNPQVNRLVVKCASNLSLDDLIFTTTRFFRQFGIKNYLEFEKVQNKLTLHLNKVNHSEAVNEIDPVFMKEIVLLLLQCPEDVIDILFKECIKNVAFCNWLRPLFKSIRGILEIESIALFSLGKIIRSGDNILECANLTRMLIETDCCSYDKLYKVIFKHLIQEWKEQFRNLNFLLKLLNQLEVNSYNTEAKSGLGAWLIQMLEEHRCNFLNFSNLDMEISIECTLLLKKLAVVQDWHKECSPLNKYYTNPNSGFDFLNLIYSNFDIENYGDAVSKLLQVLSKCVPDEWSMITAELSYKFSAQKTVELLSDVVMLICKVTNTQDEAENPTPFNSLKFYLENYGQAIKYLQEKQHTLDFDAVLIQQMFRLFRVIPAAIRQTEAINLIPLLPTDTMVSMKNDRVFVASLVSLDPQLSKIIVQKIM